MTRYTAIIIDDEKKAIEGLELLIDHLQLPIHILGKATRVKEAILLFKSTLPDIVFLDIEMPGLTGFDFIDGIYRDKTYIVFTTAHEKYALKAIKNSVNDYLLKPISSADLVQTTKKAFEYLQERKQLNQKSHLLKLHIPTNQGTVFKNLEDILYIKAQNRYSEITCVNNLRYLVCKNLGEYENELKEKKFFRVHKSFLVNCIHVTGINNSDGDFVELTGGSQIEISQRKKAEFIKFIKP